MSAPRPRLEFGRLACTAGISPCRCPLCQLENLEDDMVYGNHFRDALGRRVAPEDVTIAWDPAAPGGERLTYYVVGPRHDHARDYAGDGLVAEERAGFVYRRPARDWKSETPITSFSQGTADTISNAARCRTETKMENLEMFNPRAKDGALLWVALRMIPVSMILAGLFAALS